MSRLLVIKVKCSLAAAAAVLAGMNDDDHATARAMQHAEPPRQAVSARGCLNAKQRASSACASAMTNVAARFPQKVQPLLLGDQ